MTDTFLTVVFRNPTKEEVYELAYHAKLSAISWSHALDERDKLAALAAEPEPPDAGEVAELVVWMRSQCTLHAAAQTQWAKRFLRAADLLERLAPQPKPEGPSDDDLWAVGDEDFRANCWATDAIKYARAVLDRWGQQ